MFPCSSAQESIARLLSISCLFSNNKAVVRNVLILIIIVPEACTEIIFWLLFSYQASFKVRRAQ